MNKIENQTYNEERALFSIKDTEVNNCVFEGGESPLKESKNINVFKCTFKWKYPMWYATDVYVKDSQLLETARSGIWYTKNIKMINCLIDVPKTFRRAENIVLEHVNMPQAKETMWSCKKIRLSNVKIVGDYFGMNSEDIEIDNMELDGNYTFDGARNITIKNSILRSKDSFWNTENVTVVNCTIIGEYIGWNSKNMKFINCHFESHQGFCYIDDLKIIHSELVNSDLCFEYCSNLDVDILTEIDSVINPYSGIIRAESIKKLILDDKYIDKSKTIIQVKKNG